ncbi:MoxR family ATPase [Georgenia sp. TF02-10]|uniref:AAA family ATPase n=1 Tax=Georgenia sp. TF02-10 TaxID=2917725 RepID=UPI001FA78C03|nr:MoxR family ATPase [Georgenia sp. TF02-10]UNX54220.1 MoxR family ATPase [Georgenia sp. TF02-10]
MSTQSTGIRDTGYVTRVRAHIRERVVGREHELDLVLAAVAAGRDILLEGPPGTSKSTLLRAIAEEWGIPFVLVEGNADLTPSKLIGGHDPARVLREGYRDENFVDGPLVRAMREGGFLYIEEFNRAPDDTINTLLTAMAEREVTVPRVGTVTALPTFRVIATMNPYDNVGTTRLSSSVHDRFNRLVVDYQDAASEREIVALRTGFSPDADVDAGSSISADLAAVLVTDAVALTRATRDHENTRQGSSVRGAIDLALVAAQLLALRGITSPGDGRVTAEDTPRRRYAESMRDAALVALSGRIHVDEAAATTPERVIHQIWEDHFILLPAAAEPG